MNTDTPIDHSSYYKDIRVFEYKTVVHIVLDRPNALNALSFDMVCSLKSVLRHYREAESIKILVFSGSGDKAFCSGGDVKAVYHLHRTGDFRSHSQALDFFKEEYELDLMIQTFEKPVVAFIDGICMGGGYGIAAPCKYRVLTPQTVFAMPEVKIGFFIDVGSAYFLSRFPYYSGYYAALTGCSFSNARDLLWIGVGTHYTATFEAQDFVESLNKHIALTHSVDSFFDKRMTEAPAENSQNKGPLLQNKSEIADIFSSHTLEKIFERLRLSDSEWAIDALNHIDQACSQSVYLNFIHLHYSKNRSYKDVIAKDHTLARYTYESGTFAEGVRSRLVDKTHDPEWLHKSLRQKDKANMDAIFT